MDEIQQMLLARLAGDGSDSGAAASMPDLLEQALGDNPIAAPLAAALRRRQEAEAAQTDQWEVEDENTPDPAVADVLRRLYAEVESLRARCAILADALGACKLCWGEDITCRGCRGRGHPGGRAPRADLFETVVGPAIRRQAREIAHCATPEIDPR